MTRKRTIHTLAGLACLSILAGASQAAAHVVFDVNQVVAGERGLAALRIGHGCNGNPTTSVTVTIPDGVNRVVPRALTGWTVRTQMRRPATPTMLHGFEVNEVIASITWSGGRLVDDLYDEFEFRFIAPNKAGETIYFPVTQRCTHGSTNWTQIPTPGQKWEELDTPAPFFKIQPESARAGGHQ